MTHAPADVNREDPLVRSARREAIVVGVCWLLAMLYTVGYSYLYGYHRSPDELALVFGIPDWVLWGVFAPWGASFIFSLVFCYGIMRDSDVGADTGDDAGDDADTVLRADHDSERGGSTDV